MLTARGYWFLIIFLVLPVLGVGLNNTTLGVLGLTLLLWFLWEWLLFTLRVHGQVHRLRAVRQVRDERGPIESLWAGQTFEVKIQLQLPDALPLPYVKMTDWVPFGVDQVTGRADVDGPVAEERPLELAYHFHCPMPGRVRFEGVGIQAADPQGFFHYKTFLSDPRVYRVLPPLSDARGHSPAVKRHNLLPLLGAHRHLRPGSGSELLDLRDYLEGDPPKTIAWKASARRDRLMTKVFESEVPVRCTLFVDTSQSVRVGPPGRNALARLVEISASVAQASAAARDLTGLCLFDEHAASYTRPARGPRHLVLLLNRLAEAPDRAPSTGEARLYPLLRLAYGLARELYPGLLRRDLNHSPWWLPWLWPQPFYNVRRPTGADHFDRGLKAVLLVLWGGFFAYLLWAVERSFANVPWNFSGIFGRALFSLGFAGLTAAGFFLTLALLRGYVLFAPARRRAFHWRKRLAALLSVHYGLAPGGLGVLLEDDGQMTLYLQRFLAEHQVPYPLPMYDRQGRYLFAAPGKIGVLASALLRAVGKGHDNELFVLLADVLELEDELGPLLRAVQVARARHHRVLVISPWPPGIPPPVDGEEEPRHQRRRRHADEAGRLKETLRRTTTERFHRAYHRIRRTFARLGVQVVCAQSGQPARLILQRLEQLRYLERRR
jgi:uncharacterized protein (DUF58 family)